MVFNEKETFLIIMSVSHNNHYSEHELKNEATLFNLKSGKSIKLTLKIEKFESKENLMQEFENPS